MANIKHWILPGGIFLVVMLCLASFATPNAAARAGDTPQSAARNSFEINRDYITVPPRNQGSVDDLPPLFDARRSIELKELGAQRIETLPARVETKLEEKTRYSNKLGRAISNIAFFWLEVPRQVCISTREHNMVTGTVVGAVRGLSFAVTRLGVGVFEVFTHRSERPGNFGPIMEPEFIVDAMWGEPIPALCDPHNNFDFNIGQDW